MQCRRPRFDSWVGKIRWRRERLPTLVFWPEELHGQYSLWSQTKSQTRLSDFHFHHPKEDVGKGRQWVWCWQGLLGGGKRDAPTPWFSPSQGTTTTATPAPATTSTAWASWPCVSTRSESMTAWWASSCTPWSMSGTRRTAPLWVSGPRPEGQAGGPAAPGPRLASPGTPPLGSTRRRDGERSSWCRGCESEFLPPSSALLPWVTPDGSAGLPSSASLLK